MLKNGTHATLKQEVSPMQTPMYVVSVKGSERPTWIRTTDFEYANAAYNHVELHGHTDNFKSIRHA